jgi:hypothetical protein
MIPICLLSFWHWTLVVFCEIQFIHSFISIHFHIFQFVQEVEKVIKTAQICNLHSASHFYYKNPVWILA